MTAGQSAKKIPEQLPIGQVPAKDRNVSPTESLAITTNRLRVDSHEIERRQKFVDLGHEDLVRILAVKNLVQQNVDQFVADFFDYLHKFDEAAQLFKNRQVLDEAKKLKREYVIAMVQGEYGAAYASRFSRRYPDLCDRRHQRKIRSETSARLMSGRYCRRHFAPPREAGR